MLAWLWGREALRDIGVPFPESTAVANVASVIVPDALPAPCASAASSEDQCRADEQENKASTSCVLNEEAAARTKAEAERGVARAAAADAAAAATATAAAAAAAATAGSSTAGTSTYW
jgi:hypothetical protein